MSRAVNIDATQAHVTTTCAKQKASITAMETLSSGGTRVVLRNGDEAELVRKAYGAKVLTGPVRRAPIRLSHG